MTAEQKSLYNEPMAEAQTETPKPVEQRPPEYADIKNGRFGFHYSVYDALPTAFEHGLLSRAEERKRGLNVRKRESRSVATNVYFTTRINDLYVVVDSERGETFDQAVGNVVGIAIDRPQTFIGRDGWFTEENLVEQPRFQALVVIDRKVIKKPDNRQADIHDAYEFTGATSDAEIDARVAKAQAVNEQFGTAVPIYGVSGDLLWPEKKWARELARTRK